MDLMHIKNAWPLRRQLIACAFGTLLCGVTGALQAQTTTTTPPAAATPKATSTTAPTIVGLYSDAAATTLIPATDGVYKTNLPTAFLKVTTSDFDGALRISIGSERTVTAQLKKGSTSNYIATLNLANISMKSAQPLKVVWDPVDDGAEIRIPSEAASVQVDIDTVAPKMIGLKLRGAIGSVSLLEIQFDSDDLVKNGTGGFLESARYEIKRTGGVSQFTTVTNVIDVRPNVDGNAAILNLGSLPTDTYQIIMTGILDTHGNTLVQAGQKFNFSSFPEAEAGPHIAFPEYTARQVRNRDELFNPGDKVETRVARLYYFRDAHRVAQIINRNVKSYNRAAVTMAQQNAEDARKLADEKTADRKQREGAAIRAAEATRAGERELAAARALLEDLRAVNAQATQGIAAATQAPTAVMTQQSTDLNDKITKFNTQISTDTGSLAPLDNDLQASDVTIAGYQADLDNANAELAGVNSTVEDLKVAISKYNKTIADLTAQKANGGAPEVLAQIDSQYMATQAQLTLAMQQQSEALAEQTAVNKTIKDTTNQLAAAKRQQVVTRAKRKIIADRLASTIADRDAAIAKKEQLDGTKASLTGNGTTASPLATQFTDQQTNARTAITQAVAKIASAETNVANLREAERNKQADVAAAQEVEDRARENQFRAEVAAASADPDTYAPGDVKSADPVTQVSISVIGEGLIQLRGPIRGINKIRTMINQIDSPVGQVKVGIFTVQVNGEHGDRMEKVAARIEGNIDLSRFLTNQSLGLLRRAIQEVAGLVVKNVDIECRGNRQLDRDRRYLYGFFGRDFIDELYDMDSEFLKSENKLLSLHSMDTVSQSKAFFILSLAKNDVRQMILERFRYLIQAEMPCTEWDYRRSASMTRKIDHQKLNTLKDVTENVYKKYHFSNLHGFFNAWVDDSDAMTPMQREFIRLAQIFKAQMVAELEYKQRVIERGLIEDQANTEDDLNERLGEVRTAAQTAFADSLKNLVASQDDLTKLTADLNSLLTDIDSYNDYTQDLSALFTALRQSLASDASGTPQSVTALDPSQIERLRLSTDYKDILKLYAQIRKARERDPESTISSDLLPELSKAKEFFLKSLVHFVSRSKIYPDYFSNDIALIYNELNSRQIVSSTTNREAEELLYTQMMVQSRRIYNGLSRQDFAAKYGKWSKELAPDIQALLLAIGNPQSSRAVIQRTFRAMETHIWRLYQGDQKETPPYVKSIVSSSSAVYRSIVVAEDQITRSKNVERRVRRDIDHRKLLEFLTDEQEEKYIELEEGCRAHIAQIDNYLKRLAIALEDDFKVQFYDPAFAEVRRASREWDVNLGQVERTTILTNNRAFAKVSPQATMEFDLPKRDIMITEAMSGAKALVSEYGNLMQDPTFLSATAMLSGSPAVGGVVGRSPVSGLPGQGLGAAGVRNVLPGQSTDANEQLMAQTGGPNRTFGSEFEKLIPDPAVYKIETGTGFEIRPVIQPDGHSIVYDFDYMYTTNVREPVRPDEKHLGRVKRHFIHTEVQTSSFELREISRYQVALKVSRTSRGVPLMEDIPAVGILFRPLPSAESSLQQNIILGQSTVYPTLFDLMGLRWSKHVVDLDHINLRDLEHVVRGRNTVIHDFTFDEGARRVDEFLDVETKDKQLLRQDLYRQQRQPSPYHPGGYHAPRPKDERDPTGHEFDRPDTRPEDYREPVYDSKYRVPVDRVPQRNPRPEVIDIKPDGAMPALAPPTNSGFSRPQQRPAPEEIQVMKYETARPNPGVPRPPQQPAKATTDSSKPKMVRLPTIGTRKK